MYLIIMKLIRRVEHLAMEELPPYKQFGIDHMLAEIGTSAGPTRIVYWAGIYFHICLSQVTEVLNDLSSCVEDVQYSVSFLKSLAPGVYRWPETEDRSTLNKDELVMIPAPKEGVYKRVKCFTFKEGDVSSANCVLGV